VRQATWNELFPLRDEPLVLAPEVPQEPRGWRRLFWWEELITFSIVAVMTLAVAASVQRADWVDTMPALYPVAMFGLVLAALLSRAPWREPFLHPVALLLGAAASLGQVLFAAEGAHPVSRYQDLHARMAEWFSVAFEGGISNDELPFIVLVVPVTFVAAYASAWAVFRWHNVWLALVPAGSLLLANISGMPDQASFAFVVFVFGGALLVTRMHLLEQARAWRAGETPYPPLLSLTVLHATFWAALVLLAVAWLMPRVDQSGALEALWERATDPVEERASDFGRLFAGIDGRRSVRIHSFDDILPFLAGPGSLSGSLALDVEVEPLDQPRYLRAQAYYLYTPEGWERGATNVETLVELQVTQVDELLQKRLPVSVRIVATGETGDTLFTVGQPRRVDREAHLSWWGARNDVIGLRARDRLDRGDVYESVGTVSAATADDLRAAGRDYPAWVTLRYFQLPDDFPASVSALAGQLTANATNEYDAAVAIERYLRAIPYDLSVPEPPRGADAIEYFLFEAQRGYFDYHASAMVVMLRSQNIPARLAIGYVLQPDERLTGGDRYLVTEQSAFAWPEVYFPTYGWVEFNPTPSLPPVERATGVAAPAAGLGPDGVPDLGIGGIEQPGRPGLDEPLPGGDAASNAGGGSNAGRWVLTAVGSAFGVLTIGGLATLALAWRRGLGGLSPTARLWAQTVRLASWARVPHAAGQTPREYARAVRDLVAGADAVELLADAYVRQAFGRREIDGAERARLEQAWRALRWPLLRRLLRLA
jgi:transglutaminase-like putative cysteine protease